MRDRQENLICKNFQQDILSEERKDLGKSWLEYSRAPLLQYVGPPVVGEVEDLLGQMHFGGHSFQGKQRLN